MLPTLLDTAELRGAVPSTGDKEESDLSLPTYCPANQWVPLSLLPMALGVRVWVQVRQPPVLFPMSRGPCHGHLWPLHIDTLPSEAGGHHLCHKNSGHQQCWTSIALLSPMRDLSCPGPQHMQPSKSDAPPAKCQEVYLT